MTISKIDAISSLVGGNIAGTEDGSVIKYLGGQTPPTDEAIDAEVLCW